MSGSSAQPTLAIVGANGFIGRHLTLQASSEGILVNGVVRSKDAARAAILAGAHPVIVAGLTQEALLPAFQGAAAVVHLAQIGAETADLTYQAVNVGGTRAVIAAAQAAGVPRVVFLSGLGVARYGMAAHCTNPYFLSKLQAEVDLYGSGLQVVVFRPSYIVGPGGGLIPRLVREMEAGEVERVGDGAYRMQPIGVRDAAAAILAAVEAPRTPAVFDLVGPEPMRYADFIDRVANLARADGRGGTFVIREVPIVEAVRQARAGGYRGNGPDELDCLLCDEVADARPLEALLGRFLAPVDQSIAAALRSGGPV